MFLQICLMTAALHFGRKLLQSRNDSARRIDGAAPRGDAGAGAAPASGQADEALAVYEHVSAQLTDPLRPRLPPHPERAEVEEHFNLALASAALTTVARFLPQLRFLGGVSVMFGSIPIFARAMRRLAKERRVGIEVLDSAGIIASMAARQYVVSAVMSLIYATAQKLRVQTEQASRQSMLDVFGRELDHVWVLKDGVEVSVPVHSLSAGDVVVVGAGLPVPADGVVIEGAAMVDQHVLTGESQPADKAVGDKVLATTIVSAGKLHIRVETAGRETAAAEIAEILQKTADFASSIEQESRKIADASAVPIMALAALSFPAVGVRGTVALLNISIPDNVRVITPFSMLNYLRKAYDMSILVKDGRSLQLLPRVDTVVFDKTGTLTEGNLRVLAIHTTSGVSQDELLASAAAAEHRQTHPIAQAIIGESLARGLPASTIEEAEYEIGFGLTARIGNRTVRVGSKRFMAFYALGLPADLRDVEAEVKNRGTSLVYVAWKDSVAGMIEIEPVLRPEVPGVIRALKERGLSLYMLSGDHEGPTKAIADLLGFDGYAAEVLPQDKARIIELLQAQRRTVCFVGDGINDAIALKKANVSVSMSGASTVAIDSAQVTIMDQGLSKLPELFTIASELRSNMDSILLSALIPSAVAVGGVFLAGFGTGAVAAVYAASMVSGVTIALWPHRQHAGQLVAAAFRRDRALDRASTEG
jgi:heavy metal translocating P-type ATPase